MFFPNILHLYHPFYNAVKISGPLILIWYTYVNIYVFIIIYFCLPFMSSFPVTFSCCAHGSTLDFCNFTNKIMYIKMIHSKFYMLQAIYLLPLILTSNSCQSRLNWESSGDGEFGLSCVGGLMVSSSSGY